MPILTNVPRIGAGTADDPFRPDLDAVGRPTEDWCVVNVRGDGVAYPEVVVERRPARMRFVERARRFYREWPTMTAAEKDAATRELFRFVSAEE